VFFCCVFVSFLILVCVFAFLPFLVVIHTWRWPCRPKHVA
jgi:hypothetical protein